MKVAVLFAILSIAFSFSTLKVYNCGGENDQIKFAVNGYNYGQNNGFLEFQIDGSVDTQVQTSYTQIRTYSGAPDFTKVETRAFQDYQGTRYPGSTFFISQSADFTNLGRATYKVTVTVFDSEDQKLGCAAFYANQDQSFLE